MLSLNLGVSADRSLTVLCLGAHSDDIEIGCGGTILQLLAGPRPVHVHWIVLSGDRAREHEARRSAARFLRRADGRDVEIAQFRDGFFPFQGTEVKEHFEALKTRVEPDVIFTHHRADRHQDHRLVAELTWNTFRRHLILEYEIPKYEGDLGTPNIHVPLNARARRLKLRILMSEFVTQQKKAWFTEDVLNGLMRLRGLECAAASGFAEAFHGPKLVLAIPDRP